VRHRVQQTVRYLGPAGADDRHATETARILRQLGADEELVVAGMLHDAAKPANTLLWHRVAGVLLERFAPRIRRELSRGDSTFARYLDHPHRSAEEARSLGLGLDSTAARPIISRALARAFDALTERPTVEGAARIVALVLAAKRLGVGFGLWGTQNRVFALWRDHPEAREALRPLADVLGFAFAADEPR